MTKGNKDKLRAELAGKAMQGAIEGVASWGPINFEYDVDVEMLAKFSCKSADALMAELGLSLEENPPVCGKMV